MEAMTPKQRMLTAFRREIPDRVPVQIGLGPWWGARFFGYTCWDVYLHENPSQVDVEFRLAEHFGHDEWTWVSPALAGGSRDGPPHIQTKIASSPLTPEDSLWAMIDAARHVGAYDRATGALVER